MDQSKKPHTQNRRRGALAKLREVSFKYARATAKGVKWRYRPESRGMYAVCKTTCDYFDPGCVGPVRATSGRLEPVDEARSFGDRQTRFREPASTDGDTRYRWDMLADGSERRDSDAATVWGLSRELTERETCRCTGVGGEIGSLRGISFCSPPRWRLFSA